MLSEENGCPTISIYSPPDSSTPWYLEELAGTRPVRYFSFGRRALVEAFRLCGVGQSDTVLLPSYICRDVLSSLYAVGAKPIYYHVKRNLQADLDPDSVPPAKAVLAVNYFGFPQDLDVFEEYCDRVGAVLIEDNAHGLFSSDEEGRLLGTRTDLGIFSLRKSIPLPNGAALVINRSDLHERLSEQEPFEFGGSDIFFKRKQKLRSLIGFFGIWGANVILTMLRMRRWVMTGSPDPPREPAGEFVLPEPSKCTPLINDGINTAHPKLESHRRRHLYTFLDTWMRKNSASKPVFDGLPNGVVPYGYPFLCDSGDFKHVERLLFKKGFFCISWPDLPDAIKQTAPSFYKQIRLVPFLW